MRHINDQTLDHLLQDSLGDREEHELEMHIQQCHTCATRLREWEVLFPQIRGVAPAGEEGLEAAAMAPARSSVVILPDWSPPPEAPHLPRSRPSPLWAIVAILAGVAVWLAIQKSDKVEEPILVRNEPLQATDTPSGALGSGLGESAGESTQTTAFAESAAVNAVQSEVPGVLPESAPADSGEPAATEPVPEPETVASTPPPSEALETENRPVIRREEPVRFPIKATNKTPAPVNRPAITATNQPAGDRTTPLPAEFTRVSLGEAIARLGGSPRMISGMTPEAVEIAAGSALPGADPGFAVVRMIYNSPSGRIILDQQKLNRRGSQEPDIAVNTAPSGVSVAQWVDWKGYWISLASRANQESLLALANRIRESN